MFTSKDFNLNRFCSDLKAKPGFGEYRSTDLTENDRVFTPYTQQPKVTFVDRFKPFCDVTSALDKEIREDYLTKKTPISSQFGDLKVNGKLLTYLTKQIFD